jgi:hypothetical protein
LFRDRGILGFVMYPQGGLPREFRMAGGFGRMVLPFVLLLVFFGMIMLLLFSIFLGLAGGIVAAVVGPLVLLGVLYGKFSRMKNGTVVRFSEYGVELSDTMGFRIRLAWPDITRIGQVHTQMAKPGAIGSDDGLQVSVGPVKSQGVIGWGERVVPPRAPGWMRENLAGQAKNPFDGRPEVAIPLGGLDPNWMNGPMGQWVRLYRPDLLGGGGYVGGGYPQPGHPAAGQPSYPAMGQPGYPPASQPGYPSVGQPGYPPAGQPAYPAAGPAGYPPVQAPGYPQGGQPGYGYPPR